MTKFGINLLVLLYFKKKVRVLLSFFCTFCRFAIDTMQSVCLDEFGGEKAIPSSSQETTLIQHTFGGHLQSQVMHPSAFFSADFIIFMQQLN